MIFFILQNSRTLWGVRGFKKISKLLQRGKLCQMVVIYQTRNNGWDGKSLIIRTSSMTAPRPAVLMIWLPGVTEFIGKTLTFVTVTGHAPVPVEILTQFQFSRIWRKRRFDKWVVCGSGGRKTLPRNWYLEMESINTQQSK